MSWFRRQSKFKVVKPIEQPAEQENRNTSQTPPVMPLPPQEPKTRDEQELEALKQRWVKALTEYSYGRFSGKTVVLNGRPYYKHMILETSQGPGWKSETFIGLNADMAPCIVKTDYTFGPMGLLDVKVQEQPINAEKAKALGLTPEEALRILEAMEKLELSW